MTHPIIKTEKMKLQLTYTKNQDGTEYLLCNEKDNFYHLPLNNAPILEGVPLLPPLEDEVEKLAFDYTSVSQSHRRRGFIDGYNKAKEDFKYTEEDILSAIEIGYQCGLKHDDDNTVQIIHIKENFIQSLQQPKYPVAFECEIDNILSYDAYDGINALINPNFGKPKIITNFSSDPQGLTQLVGKYIF